MAEQYEEEDFRDDFRCPRCGDNQQLTIIGFATFHITADGTDDVGDHEWDDDCVMGCGYCAFNGKVKDFEEPEAVADVFEAEEAKH